MPPYDSFNMKQLKSASAVVLTAGMGEVDLPYNIYFNTYKRNNNNVNYITIMKRDDTLWKALLEDIFDFFLLFFFKEEAKIFDLERGFEFLDKELEEVFSADERAHPRFVDKLVKVFTKEGKEEWVLVHVEVQGYNDADFARRMFTYFYRILDRYGKFVTSIAIYTGSNRNYMPDVYKYSFLGIENTFRYNVYKVIDQDANELTKNDNPFALVILTVLIALQKGKMVEEELLPLKISILKALAKKPLPAAKVRAIMNFLKFYVRFEKPENNAKFEEAINTITGKNKTTMGIEEFLLQRAEKQGIEKGREKGREEGIEKGREEKSVAFVKSLLANTDFDDEKIAALADVTVAFVKEIKAARSA